ncbi:MAG TPA: hypothetical protein PKA17_06450, partial [Phenylobacterium sp.]|nr:hypothetical protein [Phenylobacterium sp.]
MTDPHRPYRPPLYLWLVAALALAVVDPPLPADLQADLLAAARTAYGLTQTPQFERALRAAAGQGPVYIARDRPRGDVDEVLARLRGEGRYLPLRLVLMSDSQVRFAALRGRRRDRIL